MVIHLASYVPKLPRMLSGRVDHARHLRCERLRHYLRVAPLPGSSGRWDWSGLVLDADPAQVPRGPAIVLRWLWEE
jgi:hypothetical protein